MVYAYAGVVPIIDQSAFIHPLASVIGNVIIGAHVFVGSGAAIRGDIGEIIIEKGCNVQENCIIHTFPGKSAVLREMAHIGHGAIVHGAEIGRNALIGMNAVIMDQAVVGEDSVIGALSFVPSGTKIPSRSVGVGNPVKIVKQVSDKMLAWKSEGTRLYQELTDCNNQTLKEVEPLRDIPQDRRPLPSSDFKLWNETK